MRTDYKYIRFEHCGKTPSGKADIYSCVNQSSGVKIGEVRWYSHWRRYCYLPNSETVYSAGCLNDLVLFICGLMCDRMKEQDKEIEKAAKTGSS